MKKEHNQIAVLSDDSGIRLDRWFKRHHPETPFGIIAKLVRKGLIRINGKRAEVSTKINEADNLTFPELPSLKEQKNSDILNNKYKEDLLNSVIFKDENIIVINKPAGLAVQGGSKITISVDSLLHYLKFDSENKPKLVHRIDKETSGILVLARNNQTVTKLAWLFKSKDMTKSYIALLEGLPRPYTGKVESSIEKLFKDGYEKMRTSDEGKLAISTYQVIDHAADKFALVAMQPVTGRTHQLRIHAAQLDCPIVGDDKYNLKKIKYDFVADRLFLHAYSMEFTMDNKFYRFSADLPNYFSSALKHLGLELK
ncbi:MAG: RluA family pseudouridine synthase [Rickettsiales bacterium]